MDDAALADALRARDEGAFRTLVDAWTPLMTRVARSHVSTDASADEVVQDAWLAVLKGIDRFEGRSSLRTWTFRILTNIARTRGVREKRSVPLSSLGPTVEPDRFRGPEDQYPGGWKVFPVDWPSPEDAAVEAERTQAVTRAIQALPERQQLVITLRDVHGFSGEEVCELLELTQANQRVLLHRARAAVRAAVADAYEERAEVGTR
ncbi:RNA polymerase sigma factor [Nocardioides humilatus]|uniref:RNA polymerase sigma factor n=1 Tax=Nocardioides humilatus TaxID=2607660 RepID=UPI001FE36CE7|nr:sigma-70 family RNA polymerase sigma factor [Nocardioides humilatus]